MIQLSWTQFLAGAFALVVAVAAATFKLVSYAKEAEVAGYRLSSQIQDRRLQELEKRLDEWSKKGPPTPAPGTGAPSAAGTDAIAIQIFTPKNGETVDQFGDVRAAIKGHVPKGYKSILVVRDPVGQWWSWGTAATTTWRSIQFGMDVDRGKQFEVRIIVTNEDLPSSQPRRYLPEALASESVVVTRR